jgi:hypothetical protein
MAFSSSIGLWSLTTSAHRVCIALVKTPTKASNHGLVVKAEDSWPRDPGFKPPLGRPFFRYHLFGSKLKTKIVENSNLALLHVIPQMGGWTLRNGRLIKSSYMVLNEL